MNKRLKIFVCTLIFLPILILAAGCTESPEKAKEKLLKMGISYSDAGKFFEAVSNNDINVTKLFLETGLDPNARDDDENTALIIAASKGYIEIAQFLLDHNADFLIKNNKKEDALCWAAFNGNKEIIKLLVNKGQNPSEGLPPAFTANNAKMAATLLECGADPNSVIGTEYGNITMLIGAAFLGNVEMVEVLIDHGANVEDYYDTTALIVACQSGGQKATDMANMLIAKGANIDARDIYGSTPLMYAAKSGNTVLTKLLLEKGAEVNAVNNDNETALYIAIYRAYTTDARLEVMKLLLDYGADKTIRGGQYNVTPLELIEDIIGVRRDTAAYNLLLNYTPKQSSNENKDNSSQENAALVDEIWQLLSKANQMQNNMWMYESKGEIEKELQPYFTKGFISNFVRDGLTYLEDDGSGNKGWVPNFCISGDLRYYIPEYEKGKSKIQYDDKEIKLTQQFDGATEDGEYHSLITTVIVQTSEGLKIDSISIKNE